MIRIATSSWSLHGALGQVWYAPDTDGKLVNQSDDHTSTLSLLELPAFVARDGIHVLEICHFHFPSTDDDYLAQLKDALESANVELANVLIDTGNLSNLDEAEWRADVEMTKGWMDVAAKLGAKGVRIHCGTEPPAPETIKRSALALRELADYGQSLDLSVTTENWRTTSVQPRDLLDIMEQADRPLKLCLDFGNAEKTDDKYGTISRLLPRATSLHCKGNFRDDTLDVAEFDKSLSMVKDAQFDGHIALIYGGVEDEWSKVLILKQHVERTLL